MMQGTIRSLYYYPVKGLSPQPLNQVELQVGQGFPLDRLFGFARHDSGFDPAHPQPLPKSRFLMLMWDERLAELRTPPPQGSLRHLNWLIEPTEVLR